jgi:ABC-type uncharacterized transport system permease subunit
MALTVLAGASYAAAGLLYLAYVWWPRERLGDAGRSVLALAAAVHAADIAAHCMRGVHPASNARAAVAFAGFAVVGIYLALAWRYRLTLVGALVAPVALLLLITARVTPVAIRPEGIGVLGRIHITLAVVGTALFAVAAIVSVLYLAQVSQLKSKNFGVLFHRAPPLEVLDVILQRCVSIGFPVFTVAIILGALWLARIGGPLHATPQYALALVAWFAFAGLLLARAVAGWHGRRAALLAIVGFVSSLAVIVLYLVRSVLRT